jgi:hypothetical protein
MALKTIVLKDDTKIELRALVRGQGGNVQATLSDGSTRELALDQVNLEATLLENAPIVSGSLEAPEILELKGLSHDIKSDYLVIEGLVRNVAGTDLRNLVGKVSGVDGDGRFVTSEEVLLDFNPLATDAESPFKAVVRTSGRIATIKVQFRYLLGDLVPHCGIESSIKI